MMGRLKNSWHISTSAGEPHAKIRVRNLQAFVRVGNDAWGRSGKVQPVLISVAVSLRDPFETASAEDAVNNSTIHYGILSKKILEAVEDFHRNGRTYSEKEKGSSLRLLLDHISEHLSGFALAGTSNLNMMDPESPMIALLSPRTVRSLELKIMLPKASLIGSGVSLFGTNLFSASADQGDYCVGLALHDLKVQTLIGVNPNERLAKQIIVANIEIDQWTTESDSYTELEQLVVKTIEESSFQTLEALATHIGLQIVKYFIIPIFLQDHPATASLGGGPEDGHESAHFQRIRICLEKPTAVTLADAPAIEMLFDSNPLANKYSKKLWLDWKQSKKPPFPLQGRLDEWIRENDTEIDSRTAT